MFNKHIVTIVLLVFSIGYLPALAQQKRALLIAVGDYPANSGWKRLSSMNDVQYLRKALQAQGFAENAITVLENEKATLEGIRAALALLEKQSKPGDIVMLHFSGHGQQIFDDDGDEADGYDEAIIPFDARSKYDPIRYQGELHLRDDEIGRSIDRISTAVGSLGSVLVSIDACHSGTATRTQALAIARGEPTPFTIPGKAKVAYHAGATAAGQADFLAVSTTQKSNVIVFSASSPNQVNYETRDANQQGVGSLSYAMAQSLLSLPANASYQDLFYSIKSKIQAEVPSQVPMMEGDGKQKIFSGQYTVAQSNLYVDRWISDSTFTLNKGTLQQLVPGAVLSIIDPATGKTAGTASIITSTAVESVALTNAKLDKANAWVLKIQSLPAPPYNLQVAMDDKASWPKEVKKQLQQWLGEMAFVQQEGPANCWISYSADTGIIILSKEGVLPYYDAATRTGKLDAAAKKGFTAALQMLAKSIYIRKLPDGGPLAETVTWQISPSKQSWDITQELSFTRGQSFDLKLTNNGKHTIYFTLLNILPDNSIEVLLPDETAAAQEFAIPPGESFTITENMVEDDAKAGREFLRVMVSETAFDIRPVFKKDSHIKRSSPPNSWETALQQIMQNEGTNMAVKRSVSVNEITLLTQSFVVR